MRHRKRVIDFPGWHDRHDFDIKKRVFDERLDVQVGLSSLEEELPPLRKWLARPNFHLGIDPEFAMTKGGLPGKRIGTFDAKHINFAIDWLAGVVDEYRLPPKVLVVHRFTRPMVTNSDKIELDPYVQVVMQMDGWGPPAQKID